VTAWYRDAISTMVNIDVGGSGPETRAGGKL
jgi:hypothetical protein